MINKAWGPYGPSGSGGKLAARLLSPVSAAEHEGAGLDHLTDVERTAFTELNEAYVRKYSFPFIITVRDHDRKSEFTEACRQVERIARLRLEDMLP